MNNLFFKEEKIASFKQGSKDDLPGVLPPGGNVTMPNSSNISGSILHKDKSSEDSKVDTGKPVVTGKPVDTSKQLDTGKQVDTGKHNVIETNKLTIQRTGSSYVVKNKTPADAFPGAGTNIIPEKSDVLSAGSKQTIDTHGASNALGASNAVHGIPGSTGDYQVVRKKTYQESVKKHASILGNDFSPKTNKSSTTPYKKDLTRKALAQRESESPKAVKMNKQKTTTDILSEARAVVDTVRTGVDRLVGRHNSGGACSSNSAVKKHSTPYKVDLTRKTIAQRESSASSSHTKVTMYNTSASNTPGKHVYTKSETMSFSQADEKTPVKHKIKSHASLPVSSTQKTFNQASLNSSHGTFSQSEVHHHANLPNKPAPNAGNIHTRVTMYETPTKTTPNVDVLRRLNTDPLPATQAQTNRQPVHATNILCFVLFWFKQCYEIQFSE